MYPPIEPITSWLSFRKVMVKKGKWKKVKYIQKMFFTFFQNYRSDKITYSLQTHETLHIIDNHNKLVLQFCLLYHWKFQNGGPVNTIQTFEPVFRILKIHRNDSIKTHNLILPLALHKTIRKKTSKFQGKTLWTFWDIPVFV